MKEGEYFFRKSSDIIMEKNLNHEAMVNIKLRAEKANDENIICKVSGITYVLYIELEPLILVRTPVRKLIYFSNRRNSARFNHILTELYSFFMNIHPCGWSLISKLAQQWLSAVESEDFFGTCYERVGTRVVLYLLQHAGARLTYIRFPLHVT